MVVGGTRKAGYFLEPLSVTSKQQKSIFLHGHEYVMRMVVEVCLEKVQIVGRLQYWGGSPHPAVTISRE
jgi:hypothetical protein